MNRFHAIGTRKWAESEPALSYNRVKFRLHRGGNRVEEPDLGDPNQFATEMDAFCQCILENKQPKASGETGLRDVRIMMAIYEAAQSGKTVKLSERQKKTTKARRHEGSHEERFRSGTTRSAGA